MLWSKELEEDNEWWISKYLEGSDHGLIQGFTLASPDDTDENHKNLQSGLPVPELTTSWTQEYYHSNNPRDLMFSQFSVKKAVFWDMTPFRYNLLVSSKLTFTLKMGSVRSSTTTPLHISEDSNLNCNDLLELGICNITREQGRMFLTSECNR
jgi:hypothetical protein